MAKMMRTQKCGRWGLITTAWLAGCWQDLAGWAAADARGLVAQAGGSHKIRLLDGALPHLLLDAGVDARAGATCAQAGQGWRLVGGMRAGSKGVAETAVKAGRPAGPHALSHAQSSGAGFRPSPVGLPWASFTGR